MQSLPFLLLLLAGNALLGADASATVEFHVQDATTTATIPCRVHLFDEDGKAVKPDEQGLPFWRDHFVCDGTAKITVPAGSYRCEIERGPEYRPLRKAIVA